MFYNARYYDPNTARFTQADTIVPNPANPQHHNRYTYVQSSPLIHTDPTGHCPPNVPCYDDALNWGSNDGGFWSSAWNGVKSGASWISGPFVDTVRNDGRDTFTAVGNDFVDGVQRLPDSAQIGPGMMADEVENVIATPGIVLQDGQDCLNASLGACLSTVATAAELYFTRGRGSGRNFNRRGGHNNSGPTTGSELVHVPRPVVDPPAQVYGPFHRLESTTQRPSDAARSAEDSFLWGNTPRSGFEPTVQAYEGPLPHGARGIEFYTTTPPHPDGLPHQPHWYLSDPGVVNDEGAARITCIVVLNTQC